jgi:hypothetical protein
MKKLVLLCFLSIVAMLNSTTFAQDCCFWVEKNGATIPEETYSLNTPGYQNTDYYYIHFNNTCGLDSNTTKVSIGWEIYRDGQLLDNGTDPRKLSQYADVSFQINISGFGWAGVPVKSGLGDQYTFGNFNNPTYADFPGAIPEIGNAGSSYLINPSLSSSHISSIPNAQNYNFFYLHYLQYASRNNAMRMQVYWKQYGVYDIKFTLYSRTCGTEIQEPYNSNNQHTYYGGHQSTVTGIIAQYALTPMPRGSHYASICSGETFTFGVKPDGTPYSTPTTLNTLSFNNVATWNPNLPNSNFGAITNMYIVPSYTQPTPCFGPKVARIDTLYLTVNPIPTVPNANNREICGVGEVTLAVTNVLEGVTYNWYSDASLTNLVATGTTATVSVLNPSNVTTVYNYYVTASSPTCTSAPKMVTVTSNPIPDLSLISYNESTCPVNHTEAVGVNVLTDSYTGALTYTWTGATGTTANANVNINTTCEQNYPYSVLVRDAKMCSNTISGTILATDLVAPTVYPMSMLMPTTIGCNLDAVPEALTLEELISAGFIFSDNCTNPLNGTQFTVQVSRVETELGCTNTLKRYYILYDNCGNPSLEFYLEYNVIDNVAPTFTPNLNSYVAVPGPDCSYIVTAEMLEQIGAAFEATDNCSQVAITYSVEPNQVLTSTTMVDVTFTDACGNYSTSYVTITMPNVLTSANTVTPSTADACYGNAFTFNVTADYGVEPYTITWSDPALEGFNPSVTPVLTDEFVDETFTYMYTVTDANGCSTSNTITVLVHGKPVFTVSDDVAICLGQSTTLLANYDITPGGGDGEGEIPTDPINTFLWSTGATTASILVNPTVTTTYTVTVTSPYGCTNTESVTVTVNELPEFIAVKTADNTFCVGYNGSINILPNDETYNYFIGSTPITLPYENLMPGNYVITAQNPSTLCTKTAPQITILNAPVLPVATLAVSPITTNCLYEPINVTLTATSTQPDGAIYTMYVNGTPLENIEGVATYTFTAAGTYTFTATATNPVTGCVSTIATQVVNIYPLPVDPTLTANDTEICLGETVTLTATPMMTGYTYQFGALTPSPMNYLMVTPELIGENTYSVLISSDHGCTATAAATIIVNPLPVVESISASYTCPGLVNPVTPVVSGGTPQYTFNWDGNVIVDGPYVTLQNVTCGGENLIHLNVVDSKGCSAHSSVTITINDTVAPTIVFEGTISPELTVDCGSIPTQRPQDVNVSDNCTAETAIIISMLPEVIVPGSCANTYNIQRTWRAQDACGNYSTITQLIHVVDVTKPILTSVPASVEVSCDNIPTIDVNSPYLMASDNCSGTITYSYTSTVVPGSTANTYVNTLTWVATDVCGNVSLPMTQTITVTDEIAPVLVTSVLPENIAISCSDIIPTPAVIEYSDNCEGLPTVHFTEVSTKGTNPDSANYYNYTITRTWYASDAAGNSTTPITQVITVQDLVGPVIDESTIPTNLTLACSDPIPAPANIIITDNCDASLNVVFTEVSTKGTDPNSANYYTYTITRTWTANDASGFTTSTITQVITVQDLVAPVVVENTVPANITINCPETVPAPANVLFSDNCDQDLTITYNQVSTQGSDNTLPTYYNYTVTRTWLATDASGLVSPTITQVITVQDITAPAVVTSTIPANITLNCQDVIPAPATVQFTESCDQNFTITYNQVSTQGTTPNTAAYYNYTITRTWIARDASNNVAPTITQVITVHDITAPVVVENTLPSNLTLTCYDVVPLMPNVLFTDNCSTPTINSTQVSTFVNNPENANYYNYVITRTWSATDASGNVSSSVTQVITIVDTDAPTVVPASVPTDATVSCSNIPDAPTVLFTDACDATPLITYNHVSTQGANPALANYYNYTITRTWFATDASGHVSPTVTQVITVQDIVAPVVVESSIPANVTINCQDVVPAVTTVLFTDNCDMNPVVVPSVVTTRGSNPAAASYYNYTITRTWVATDASANVSNTITQVITIQDVTVPTFTFVPANITIYTTDTCGYNSLPVVTGGTATAIDNCYFPAVTYTDEIIVGANAGQWTINRTWKAQDVTGNFVTALQVITVTDNINPTFTYVPANQSVCRNYDGSYENLITTALMGVALGHDNCTTNPAITYSDNITNVGNETTDGYITRTWTVTDAVGHAVTATQTITVLHRPTVTITGPSTICQNTTIILTGNGANSYVWNTTAETPSINVTTAGTYSVVGTLTNGCSNSAEITVTQFEVPTLSSSVNDQICVGETVTLNAQAVNNDLQLVNGNWSVQMFSGSTNITTNYTNVVGTLTHTSVPVFNDTHFQLVFTDGNGCSYNHTTVTTIVTDAPRLRLYTDQAAAPNNILNVTTGQDAKFYIKVEACADLTRRAQIQFQVYKDGQPVTSLGQYLTDQYMSVSYFTAQNGITTPNPNNTYFNPIATGTFPYANTEQFAPWNGFFVSWTTNAYNWFYMHFFKERFITIDINAFSQPGQYTITYNLVGADASCNITDNSTNYTSGYSYGGSGFQFCNNTTVMASNIMVINVTGNAIPDQPQPEPLPVPSSDINVNVYPNPSNGENIKLTFDNIQGETSLRISTINGKVLYETSTDVKINKNTFELPDMNLAPGVYFIQVVNNNAVLTKKMIIQK